MRRLKLFLHARKLHLRRKLPETDQSIEAVNSKIHLREPLTHTRTNIHKHTHTHTNKVLVVVVVVVVGSSGSSGSTRLVLIEVIV